MDPSANRSNSDSSGFTGDRSISVILTDPEVLDCPICCEPLITPIFQCENGHISCAKCCTKIKNRCPYCCTPISHNRCRSFEKVLESIRVPCKNRQHGCIDTPIYNARLKHEELCGYTPCSCPFPDCSFKHSYKLLKLHTSYKHFKSVKRFNYGKSICFSLGADERFVVFQEKGDGSLFVLNNVKEGFGNAVALSRIGTPTVGSCYYELVARDSDALLTFHYFTNIIQSCVDGLPSKSYLVLPKQFFSPFEIELCISGRRDAGML